MAFKTVKEYNDDKYKGKFVLANDGDSADVIFLYRSIDDVLIADTHYVKSADYSGYVHCCGRGCPACEKGIRVQSKLFIPLYDIGADEIKFFDRNTVFENVLQQSVFSKYPNPSEYVFRIVRHGKARDINTKYEIYVAGRNTSMPYETILSRFNTSLPAHYEAICRDVLPGDLREMLNSTTAEEVGDYSSLPDYQVTPRMSSNMSEPTIPEAITNGSDNYAELTATSVRASAINISTTQSVDNNAYHASDITTRNVVATATTDNEVYEQLDDEVDF